MGCGYWPCYTVTLFAAVSLCAAEAAVAQFANGGFDVLTAADRFYGQHIDGTTEWDDMTSRLQWNGFENGYTKYGVQLTVATNIAYPAEWEPPQQPQLGGWEECYNITVDDEENWLPDDLGLELPVTPYVWVTPDIEFGLGKEHPGTDLGVEFHNDGGNEPHKYYFKVTYTRWPETGDPETVTESFSYTVPNE